MIKMWVPRETVYEAYLRARHMLARGDRDFCTGDSRWGCGNLGKLLCNPVSIRAMFEKRELGLSEVGEGSPGNRGHSSRKGHPDLFPMEPRRSTSPVFSVLHVLPRFWEQHSDYPWESETDLPSLGRRHCALLGPFSWLLTLEWRKQKQRRGGADVFLHCGRMTLSVGSCF